MALILVKIWNNIVFRFRIDRIKQRNKQITAEMKLLIKKQGQLTQQQRERYLKELEGLHAELDEMSTKV